jgi:hypothetical protein
MKLKKINKMEKIKRIVKILKIENKNVQQFLRKLIKN